MRLPLNRPPTNWRDWWIDAALGSLLILVPLMLGVVSVGFASGCAVVLLGFLSVYAYRLATVSGEVLLEIEEHEKTAAIDRRAREDKWYFSRSASFRERRKHARLRMMQFVLFLSLFVGFIGASGYMGAHMVNSGSVDWQGSARLFAIFAVFPFVLLLAFRLCFRYLVPLMLLGAWQSLNALGIEEDATSRRVLRSERTWFFANDGFLANVAERLIRGDFEEESNA